MSDKLSVWEINRKMEREKFISLSSSKLAKIINAYCKQQDRLQKEGVYFSFSNLSSYNSEEIEILIDVLTNKTISKFDGLQIVFLQHISQKKGIFEVSEYQAGPNKENLYVLSESKTLKSAISSVLKGNAEHSNRKPIKVW